MTRLDDLKRSYFAQDALGSPIPTRTGDNQVELIVDGDDYFSRVFSAISGAGRDDDVLILSWIFDTRMRKGAYPEIGELLAAKQRDGTNVWVILNGSIFAQMINIGPFGANFEALRDLTERRLATASLPPLDLRVLFDFSGAKTGSQHQKVVVVRRGSDATAWVGGIDFWKNRDDSREHLGTRWRWPDGSPWGWHDAAVEIRGTAVADVWANFVSRWAEAATLPQQTYWTGILPPLPWVYDPAAMVPAPPTPPSFVCSSPNSEMAVQILRSRYPTKLDYDRDPNPIYWNWLFPPLGPIQQVHATLTKAIDSAERYIYIEDQFLSDSWITPGEGRRLAARLSLFPHLSDAVGRGVRLILVGSGKSDPDDFPWRSRPNRSLTTDVSQRVVLPLGGSAWEDVAVWRLDNLTVHSKLMFIDDVFCAVGGANMQARSMFGVDQELHVGIVDAGSMVKEWRARLWAEHLEIAWPPPASVRAALDDLDLALGMWRESWRIGGAPGMWSVSGNPAGFAPGSNRRTLVGPMGPIVSLGTVGIPPPP